MQNTSEMVENSEEKSVLSLLECTATQICRFCLETSENYLDLVTNQRASDVVVFLQKYLNFSIDSCDSWPKNACLKCVEKIEAFRRLWETIQKSEVALREIYIKKEDVESEETAEFPESAVDEILLKFEESSESSAEESPSKPDTPPVESGNRDEVMIGEFIALICDICKKDFAKLGELRLHFRREHKKVWYVVCCKVKLRHRKHILEHLSYHTNPNAFKCPHCLRQFMSQQALSNHTENRHKPEKRVLVCDICKKTFAFKSILTTHIRELHLKIKRTPKKKRELPSPEKKCICEICGREFDRMKTLKRHFDTHASFFKSSAKTEAQFKCDQCENVYKSRHSLYTHAKKHSAYGTYKCKICPKVSPTPNALRKHVKDSHTLTRDFVCHICNKGFKRQIVLKVRQFLPTNE